MAETIEPFFTRLGRYIANALRYWEPRRLIYNAVMAAVVVARVAQDWPALRAKVTFEVGLGMFILAVIANVAYCAVYAIDLFVQFSGLDSAWRAGRVLVLVVGTAFAAAITYIVVGGF